MRLTEEKYQLIIPSDPNRSQGVHLSHILRDMALTMGILDAKYDVPIDTGDTVIVQLGMAMEDYLAKTQHQYINYHPGELTLDGIAMSPDGISVVDSDDYSSKLGLDLDTWVLHEFKCTRKSLRNAKDLILSDDKKFRLWLWQVKAYRYAINRMLEDSGVPDSKCNTAALHVMFVNGNYSRKMEDPESMPAYRIYWMEFEDFELEENWEMVTNHARYMGVIE